MLRKKFFVYLLLPPLVSFILSCVDVFRTHKIKDMYVFIFFYTLFVVFVYPDYDTFLSFFDAISSEGFFSDDIITNLLGYIILQTDLNYYNLFPILWLLTISLYFKTVIYSYGEHRSLPITIFLLFVFSLILKNWVGLTYFTLASTVCLYYGNREKKSIISFVIFSFIIFLIHPGGLMVFVPAFIFHSLFNKKLTKLSFLFLAFYAILTFFVFNGASFLSYLGEGSSLFAVLLFRFSQYTDADYIWGGKGLEMGVLGYVNIILMSFFILGTVIIVLRRRYLLQNNFSASMLLIGSIALFNSRSLWTLSERFILISLMSATLVLIKLIKDGDISNKLKTIFLYVNIITFLLPVWFHRKTRDNIFRNVSSSYEISARIAYVPSIILLIDVENFGYSDKYIMKNVEFGSDMLK